MQRTNFLSPRVMLGAQLLLVFAMVAVAMAMPPARGAILLVPLGEQARGAMLGQAIGAGARLVGKGPLAGSYVVYGDRARLAPALLGQHVLTLASPDPSCGGVLR